MGYRQFLEGCKARFKATILTSKQQPQFFKFDELVELSNMKHNWHIKFANLRSIPYFQIQVGKICPSPVGTGLTKTLKDWTSFMDGPEPEAIIIFKTIRS